jgi:hypothetical protein
MLCDGSGLYVQPDLKEMIIFFLMLEEPVAPESRNVRSEECRAFPP